jgi:hypothetical protein
MKNNLMDAGFLAAGLGAAVLAQTAHAWRLEQPSQIIIPAEWRDPQPTDGADEPTDVDALKSPRLGKERPDVAGFFSLPMLEIPLGA